MSKEEAARRIAASAIELQNQIAGGIHGDRINCLVDKRPSVVISVSSRKSDTDNEIINDMQVKPRKDIFDPPDESPVKPVSAVYSRSKPPPKVAKKTARAPASQKKTNGHDIKTRDDIKDGTEDEDLHDVIQVSAGPRKRRRPKNTADKPTNEQPSRKPGGSDKCRFENGESRPKNLCNGSTRRLRSASNDSARSNQMPVSSNLSAPNQLDRVDEVSGPDFDDSNTHTKEPYEKEESPNSTIVVRQTPDHIERSVEDPSSEKSLEQSHDSLKELEKVVIQNESESEYQPSEEFRDENVGNSLENSATRPELEKSRDKTVEDESEEPNQGIDDDEEEGSEENGKDDMSDGPGDLADRRKSEKSGDGSTQDGPEESGRENDNENELESEEPDSEESDYEESDVEAGDDVIVKPLSFEMFRRDDDWRSVIGTARSFRRQSGLFNLTSATVKSLVQCIRELRTHYDQPDYEPSEDLLFQRLRTLIDSLAQADVSNEEVKKTMQVRIRDIYLHGIHRMVLLLRKSMTISHPRYSAPDDLSALKEVIEIQDLTIALCEKPKLCQIAANMKYVRPTSDPSYLGAVRTNILPPLRNIRKAFFQEFQKRQDVIHQARMRRKREEQRKLYLENLQREQEERRRKIEERRQRTYEDVMRNRQTMQSW